MWPGGPVQLPARISVCGGDYTVQAAPTGRVAYLVCTSLWLAPTLMDAGDHAAVQARLRDPHDPLDVADLERASLELAARVVGIRRGVTGWRVAVRLCTALVHEWESVGPVLVGSGLDLSLPLWRVAAAMYGMAVNQHGEEAKRNTAAAALIAPLPWEPAWLDPPKRVPVVSKAKARASNRAFYQQFTGRPLPDA